MLKSHIYWDIMSYSPLIFNRRFRGTYGHHFRGRRISQDRNKHEAELAICFILFPCLAHSSTLMEGICSSETSIDFQRTTWRYIPEDRTLPNHRYSTTYGLPSAEESCLANLGIVRFMFIAFFIKALDSVPSSPATFP
jgi:hypothetical protein